MGLIEEAEPFFDGSVAGDDEDEGPVPVEDDFIEIGRLLGSEPRAAEVIEDEQIRES